MTTHIHVHTHAHISTQTNEYSAKFIGLPIILLSNVTYHLQFSLRQGLCACARVCDCVHVQMCAQSRAGAYRVMSHGLRTNRIHQGLVTRCPSARLSASRSPCCMMRIRTSGTILPCSPAAASTYVRCVRIRECCASRVCVACAHECLGARVQQHMCQGQMPARLFLASLTD